MSPISEHQQAPCSYRPGEWYAVAGERATVLLPGSERDRAAATWRLLDAGEGFDPVLDALVEPGLTSLSAFALLGHDESTAPGVRMLVRGAGVCVIADGVEIAGTDQGVWTERALPDVTTVSIRTDGADGVDVVGPDLPLTSGLARAARLDRPAYVAAEPVSPPEPDPLDLNPAPPADPVPGAPGPEAQHLAAVPDVAPEPDEVATGVLHDLLDGPAREDPEPEPHGVTELVISGGERVYVDRVLLIGRAPRTGPLTSGEEPRLVTVISPMQEVSSTHVEIRPGSGADHAAVVTDLGSTNGTVLIRPESGAEELTPGVAAPLVAGAVINLGDGVTIEVAGP